MLHYLLFICKIYSQKDHILLDPTGSDISSCTSKGKSQVINQNENFSIKQLFNGKTFSFLFPLQLFDCRNHIRVVQSMDNGNRLYICGTNAHNPKDYVIYVSFAFRYFVLIVVVTKLTLIFNRKEMNFLFIFSTIS